jgi:hypothetical protein
MTIMSRDDQDWQIAVREQKRMFRLAARDYGLSRHILSLETGISASTLKSWANETIIPLTGLRKLVRVIPDELTSLVFAETDKCISTTIEGDGDLDELAREANELVQEHIKARHPEGPGGVRIVPIEKEAIKERGRAVAAKVRAVQ